MEIRFWGKKSKYFEFTNFYFSRFYLDDRWWPTAEHYYQANKFTNHPELYEKVANCRLAMHTYNLSRENVAHIDSDWDSKKLNVMEKALRAKFNQNVQLKKLLISTGDALLIENSPYDKYWGVGGFGNPATKDNNKLGYLLMKIRNELSIST